MDGKIVKQRLDKAGIKQKQLADLLDVSAQSISSVLSAKDVRSSTLERIVEALGLNMTFFYPVETSITNTNSQNNNNGNIVNGTNTGSLVTGVSEAKYIERIKELEERNRKQEERIDKLLSQIDKLIDGK